MKKPVNPIQETDDKARRLARILVRQARFAAISVLEPDTGFPFTSRVLTSIDIDGTPLILVSTLSVHTKALLADPRASLLFGEPGKGDPLAYPRITVRTKAEFISRDNPTHMRLKSRFLARHPKAALYIDFMDFGFLRMIPVSANLNGGFGKAYNINREDLLIKSIAKEGIAKNETAIISRLNTQKPELANHYAGQPNKSSDRGWVFCGIDAAGFDITKNHEFIRVEFHSEILEHTDAFEKVVYF